MAWPGQMPCSRLSGPRRPQLGQQAEPPEPRKDPQVTAISPSAVQIPLEASGRRYSERLVEAERFCPGQRHRRRLGAALGVLPGNRG